MLPQFSVLITYCNVRILRRLSAAPHMDDVIWFQEASIIELHPAHLAVFVGRLSIFGTRAEPPCSAGGMVRTVVREVFALEFC